MPSSLWLFDRSNKVTQWLSQAHLGCNNKTNIVWMAGTTNAYFSWFWRVGSSSSGSCRFGVWWEPPSRFINAHLFLRLHVAEWKRELSGALIPWPNYLPKALPPNTITVEVSFQLKIWEDTDIRSVTIVNTCHSSKLLKALLEIIPGSEIFELEAPSVIIYFNTHFVDEETEATEIKELAGRGPPSPLTLGQSSLHLPSQGFFFLMPDVSLPTAHHRTNFSLRWDIRICLA